MLGCQFVAMLTAVPALGAIGRYEVVAAGILGVLAALVGVVLAGRAGDAAAGAVASRRRDGAGPTAATDQRPGADLPSGPSTSRPRPPPDPALLGTAALVVALGAALALAAVVTVELLTRAVVDPVVLVGLAITAVAQLVVVVLTRTSWWPAR